MSPSDNDLSYGKDIQSLSRQLADFLASDISGVFLPSGKSAIVFHPSNLLESTEPAIAKCYQKGVEFLGRLMPSDVAVEEQGSLFSKTHASEMSNDP